MEKYAITNKDNAFLRLSQNGSYIPVNDVKLASVWDSWNKANNVLKNSIPQRDRRNHKVCMISEPTPENECEDPVSDAAYGSDFWADALMGALEVLRQQSDERRTILSGELSILDQEVVDLYHYIENGTFNAYKGWLAFDSLRHVLKERRSVKNEMIALDMIGTCAKGQKSVKETVDGIRCIKERTYTPKVLKNLF